MAKKRKPVKKRQEQKGTNWVLIGGIIFVGVVAVGALLFLALNPPSSAEALSLEDYCAENDDRCVVIGDANAPITVVEVSDFGCPHCRDFHNDTLPGIQDGYISSGDVRWIYLPFALGNNTLPAANAAVCAQEQGKYSEFAAALFGLPTIEQGLTREGFLTAGEQIGLELDSFASCLEDGRYFSMIQDNISAATQSGVSATPTFFINGEMARGALPFNEFQRLFALQLES